LAYSFYDLVAEMFQTPDDKSNLAQQFTFKFLFDLGRTIGSSNQAWFVEKIGLGQNAIERAHALPVNMAYFGWCDLIIRSGLSHKELQVRTVLDFGSLCASALTGFNPYYRNKAKPLRLYAMLIIVSKHHLISSTRRRRIGSRQFVLCMLGTSLVGLKPGKTEMNYLMIELTLMPRSSFSFFFPP